jgi:putative thiamine transport system substrate-binding protein
MVLSNFLLSPEAQARAQDPRELGSPTVLDLARLPAGDRARFDALPRGVATLSNAELGQPLLEPHPSWATQLTAAWERRIQR